MKFGKVNNPASIDFTLPKDHECTELILKKFGSTNKPLVYVGCSKWGKKDLKNFYPKGTPNLLHYYASQFNSIELNATFYRTFPVNVVSNWYLNTPTDFRFFPKIPQIISQFKLLKNVHGDLDNYFLSILELKEKLGTVFLQMPPNFSPKKYDNLHKFASLWPRDIRLALELRHTDWFNHPQIAQRLYELLEQYKITLVFTDTAGRRDLLPMRLTTPYAFIRFTGANHSTDYSRLDDWVERLYQWHENGIREINFFIHQNLEQDSPLLAAYFIKKLNHRLGLNLNVPKTQNHENGLFGLNA